MLLDIEVVMIRSNMMFIKRTEAADRFNFKILTVKILLNIYQAYSTGLNLHPDYATIILFNPLKNNNQTF